MGSPKWFQFAFKRLKVPVVGQTGAEESQQRPSNVSHENSVISEHNGSNENRTRVKTNKVKAHTFTTQPHSHPRHSKGNHQFQLPNRLVGTKSTAQVTVRGEEVNCLLDSGSQVTTVPESFYKQHFSEQPIKPLHDLLEFEGANGQPVPYFGYITITITFPKDFIGAPIDVNTLALVVPDTSHSLLLIGTNTLDVLFDIYSDTDTTSCQPLPHGYAVVFKVIELRWKQASNNPQGVVKMQGKTPQLIPAGETVVVEGVALVSGFQDEKSVVIEHPSSSPLPGGLLVKPVWSISLSYGLINCQLSSAMNPTMTLSFLQSAP